MQTEGYLQTRFAVARFGARLGTAFARHRPSIPALCRTLTLAWRAAASKQGASSFICSQARSIGDASFRTTNRSTTVVEDACRRPMPESSKRWSSHVKASMACVDTCVNRSVRVAFSAWENHSHRVLVEESRNPEAHICHGAVKSVFMQRQAER